MRHFILIITFFSCSIFTATKLIGQTYTTVTKKCGSCGKEVSASSKVGDRCPHCGVRWGYENTNTSTSPRYKNFTLSDDVSYQKTKKTQSKTSSSKKSDNDYSKKPVVEKNPFSAYTKQQTQNWLLDKLNTYSKNYSRYSTDVIGISSTRNYSDFEFKFQDDYLIVSYLFENKEDIVIYIPLYDFNYLYGQEYGNDFSISTNTQSMYESNLTDNSKTRTGYMSVGFQNNSEIDILKQLEFAFNHLKSLSKKPLSNNLPSFTPKRISSKPSLEETQKWILLKLNSYTSMNATSLSGTTWFFKNYSFSFDNYNNLIAKFTEEVGGSIFNYIVTVPLCEVSTESVNYGGDISFSSSQNFKFYSKREKIQENSSHYGNRTTTSFEIKIDFHKEDNLYNRLIKAFNNLKSYCQTPTTKETF